MFTQPIAAVIVAAGYGSLRKVGGRPVPKVLESLAPSGDRPIIGEVVQIVTSAGFAPRIVVVNGDFGGQIQTALASLGHTGLTYAYQPARLGAADAVMRAIPILERRGITRFLTVYADMPLWSVRTLHRLVQEHELSRAAVSMVSVLIAANHRSALERYGRILRDALGGIVGVIEPGEASEAHLRETTAVNPSLWVFELEWFRRHFSRIPPCDKGDGHTREFHIPRLIVLAHMEGANVAEIKLERVEEALGINTLSELEQVRAVFRRRLEARRTPSSIQT